MVTVVVVYLSKYEEEINEHQLEGANNKLKQGQRKAWRIPSPKHLTR